MWNLGSNFRFSSQFAEGSLIYVAVVIFVFKGVMSYYIWRGILRYNTPLKKKLSQLILFPILLFPCIFKRFRFHAHNCVDVFMQITNLRGDLCMQIPPSGIAGTMQILDARHCELFLEEGYKNGTWEYSNIGCRKIEKHCAAATGVIIDPKYLDAPVTVGELYRSNSSLRHGVRSLLF